MISNLILVVGVAVLSAACRSFENRAFFRLGTLGFGATSFLAGWLLGGSVWLGVALTASWLFLPWLEILTRIRHLRIPIERTLKPRTPPNRASFPGFSDITDEIETEGFEHLEDIGWNHEDSRQFFRVLDGGTRKIQACICLAEQHEFHYTTLTSRASDGRIFMTWNYPFSYGLKLPPQLKVRRFSGLGPFSEMLKTHAQFLKGQGIESAQLLTEDPNETISTMQSEMREQISHNIDLGLLKPEGDKLIRYTPRGMFFLWIQFLRDFIRFS
jgi:hypothetical protein